MKFLLIAFSLFITTFSWAQLESEQTVSAEMKGMNKETIKPYLLFQATNQALDQYATELGFKKDEFKKNLDKKFQDYFEVYKQRKLTAKFGKKYSEQLSNEQKDEFVRGLEKHREEEYIKFSRLFGILDGHAFRQLSTNPKTPDAWSALIHLNINRGKLENLIKRMSSTQSKQYARINLMADITPISFNWNEIGLENADSFINPILSSWMKWLVANQPSNVEEINICNKECLASYEKWLQMPQDEGLEIEADLINDLWLKVSYDLQKISFSPSLNEWNFTWNGRVVLQDANTKRILFSYELSSENKSWRGLEQKDLNSALASRMYRSPLGAFTNMTKKITDIPQLNRVSRLVILGENNLGDVFSLMNLLKQEGHSINLELQLDFFTKNEAQLLCFYQGEEKSFSDLLSRPKELKSSQSFRIVNEFTGVHQVLRLVAE